MKQKQQLYQAELIKHLYYGGSLSCAELSELSEKSLPLTTQMLNHLQERKLVQETGLANSTGGRRPQTYSLVADKMLIVAVAMDQMVTRISLLDMQNREVVPSVQHTLLLTQNGNSLAQLGAILNKFLDSIAEYRSRVIGIGIGMPGFVDVKRGINHSFLKTQNGNITGYLEQATRLPVFIDNDSSLVALAEYKFGAARGSNNVMVVNLGWGTGLGMIVEKHLFRGDSGFAGEFSHIPLFTNNKLCSCGKIGCLETEASLKVLFQKIVESITSGAATSIHNLNVNDINLAVNTILDAAVAGDRLAVSVLTEIAHNVGRGIAILIHIMNPGQVVLSGIGASAGNLWLAPIYQAINENCIPKIAENTTITVSKLGKTAEIIGAAALVIESLSRQDVLKILNAHAMAKAPLLS